MKLSKIFITDPRLAVVIMSLSVIFFGATSSYLGAVFTTVEKRYEFSSMEMGILMSANDIGYLTCVVFVSYFGSKKNRQPFMLFLSGVVLSLSCFIYSFPYFIFGSKYNTKSLLEINKSDKKGFCLNQSENFLYKNESKIFEQKSYEKPATMFIMMVAGILNGVGATPFWTLGISFIDSLAGPGKSGIYIGLLFAIRTFAPILGYILGSYVLNLNEGLGLTVSQYLPGQKDFKWIGAWWVGWIVLAMGCLLPSPFMLLLRLKKSNQAIEGDSKKVKFLGNENSINEQSKSIKKHPKTFTTKNILKLLRIIIQSLRNKIFGTLIIGMIFEISSYICLFVFFNKFLEYHYRVSPSTANIMSAICMAGSQVLSGLTSGLISYFYKTNLRSMNRFHAIVNILSALLFPLLFLFPCQAAQIFGLDQHSRNTTCANNCHCQITKFEPLCFNSSTYFSPCTAGCMGQLNETFYQNCGCLKNKLATKGFCEQMCLSVYGFLALFLFVKYIGSIASVQFTQILMRLTDPKLKAVNLSLVGFTFGVCGIVLPPIAGLVLDKGCKYRNTDKFGGKSRCLIYDNNFMRNLILGVTFILQIPACILYIMSWLFTPSDYVYKSEGKKGKRNTPEINSQF